jgi:predicted NBD/HSP70 family sugar kinase
LCNELREKGILSEEKYTTNSIGRTPFTLSLNYQKYHSLCIDLQLENTLRIAIVDLRNHILIKKVYDISEMDSTLDIARFARRSIDKLLSHLGIDEDQVIGVGISVPAVFDLLNGKLVNSSVPIFEDASVKEEFKEVLGLPIYVDNIANFYALSKRTYYPDVENIVCMDISQGVGVGVISQGNLVRGKNGYGTEVAHTPIGNPEKQCKLCGGYGCVEIELSLDGILEYQEDKTSAAPLLTRWMEFMDDLKVQPELAKRVAARTGRLAGLLATILINLFDPNLFFIGGYISDLPAPIEPFLIKEVNRRCDKSVERGLQIICEKKDTEQIFVGISNTVFDGWNPLNR